MVELTSGSVPLVSFENKIPLADSLVVAACTSTDTGVSSSPVNLKGFHVIKIQKGIKPLCSLIIFGRKSIKPGQIVSVNNLA